MKNRLLASITCASAIGFASFAHAVSYSWRGVHIDEARHFFGKAAVMRIIDGMAELNLNVLHWHLVDDQGWRLEIKRYPNLTKVGSVRKIKCKSSPEWTQCDQVDHGTYGPFFYTQGEIREVVAYATAHGVTIVPEIEMPGHSLAANASYPEHFCFPELVCGHETLIPPRSEQKTIRTCCIGNDATVRFLEGILDEVCEIFPGRVIHIGGDEAPTSSWKKCPKCRARMKNENLKTPRDLQGWLMNHFIDYLSKKGRITMGWEEILCGNPDPKNVIAQCWHGPEQVLNALKRGYKVVLSPPRYLYFDYRQGLKDDSYMYNAGPVVTLQRVREFDPLAGIPEIYHKQILGAECCNWSEKTFTPEELEFKLWPRARVMAEILNERQCSHGASCDNRTCR